MIKMFLSAPRLREDDIEGAIQQIGKVMDSKQKLFVRFVRKSLRQGLVYSHYPFESSDGEAGVIEKALGRMEQLLSRPARELSSAQEDEIFGKVPGILPRLKRQGDRAVL